MISEANEHLGNSKTTYGIPKCSNTEPNIKTRDTSSKLSLFFFPNKFRSLHFVRELPEMLESKSLLLSS